MVKRIEKILTKVSLLSSFDLYFDTVVERDASDFALEKFLSQRQKDNTLYPVSLYSHRLYAADLDDSVHEKELLATLEALNIEIPYL